MWTDDPIADFARHERQERRWLESRPICSDCERPIQDDHYFEFDGEVICEECLFNHHRKWVEEF
jgi:hypothetical protein